MREPRASLVERLRRDRETHRLAWLRDDLREVTANRDAGAPERELARVSREIEELEARLSLPYGRAPAASREEYSRSQLSGRAAVQAAAVRTLRETNRRLRELRANPAGGSPDEISNLNAWKDKLEEDLSVPSAGDGSDVVGSEDHLRWRAEREEAERRIADLRNDLRYWARQRAGAGARGVAQRVSVLRDQIREQEALVRGLPGSTD